jgi:methionyl-tRNA formyltransferase
MMRVAFLTNRTTQYSLPVLKQLVSHPQCELVQAFFYDTLRIGKNGVRRTLQEFGWFGVLEKLGQMATSKARMQIAKRVVNMEHWAKSSYEFSVLKKIPFSIVQDINAPETIAKLKELRIDVLIVAVCKNILRSEVLGIPTYGAVNIHPSLLPKYRGPTPAFWALYHGDSETGVTFHRMTTKIDEGEIIGQYKFEIKPGWDEDDVSRFAFELAGTKIDQILERIGNQQGSEPISPTVSAASYFSYPTPSQRREMRWIRRSG